MTFDRCCASEMALWVASSCFSAVFVLFSDYDCLLLLFRHIFAPPCEACIKFTLYRDMGRLSSLWLFSRCWYELHVLKSQPLEFFSHEAAIWARWARISNVRIAKATRVGPYYCTKWVWCKLHEWMQKYGGTAVEKKLGTFLQFLTARALIWPCLALDCLFLPLRW